MRGRSTVWTLTITHLVVVVRAVVVLDRQEPSLVLLYVAPFLGCLHLLPHLFFFLDLLVLYLNHNFLLLNLPFFYPHWERYPFLNFSLLLLLHIGFLLQPYLLLLSIFFFSLLSFDLVWLLLKNTVLLLVCAEHQAGRGRPKS